MNSTSKPNGNRPAEISAGQIREIRIRLGMTQTEAATYVGVDLRTWQRWEQEEGPSARKPRGAARKAIERMDRASRFRTDPKAE